MDVNALLLVTDWVIAVLISIPLMFLAVECFLALSRRYPDQLPDTTARPATAILIPAHDEEVVICRTLDAVVAQSVAVDRILVVADNCNDRTVELAREHGAEVVERCNSLHRGKGFALAFGREILSHSPPQVVIVLDADCSLGPRTLEQLSVAAHHSQMPVQAAYRMLAPVEVSPDRQVAAFAFFVKNFVRPFGLDRLGCPCLLMGTGMAFPWSIFRDAPLGSAHIVEDLELTVALAEKGITTTFLPTAEVASEFPINNEAAAAQRRRWEHGHLRILTRALPRLLASGLRQRQLFLIVLALELGVPPISALALLVIPAFIATLILSARTGSSIPVLLLLSSTATASLAISATWYRWRRNLLPLKNLLRIPLYALKKIPLYLGFVFKPEREWRRTSRSVKPLDKG